MKAITKCLILILSLFPLASFAKEHRSTDAADCSKVTENQPIRLKTDTILSPKETLRTYATIDLERDSTDNGKSCFATYSLYVAERSGNFRMVRTLAARVADRAGVDIVGFSDNNVQLAADFWWATGTYISHRAVVYDSKTKAARLDELEDKISSQLPACNYAEKFIGVDNTGDAIFHVPAASDVQGCGDQGDWILDLKTGEARRKP